MIEHTRDHPFVKKAVKEGKRRPPPGCEVCNRARTHLDHHGTTQSINEFLSRDIQVYRAMKAGWGVRLLELLRASPLPVDCERIVAEGEMTWPRRVVPDQGNHRFLIEKALGDALQEGGYLVDDSWDRYEFGNLTYRYEKGVARTSVVLFPSLAPQAGLAMA